MARIFISENEGTLIMKFYWYDHSSGNSQPKVPGLSKLVDLFNATIINTPGEFKAIDSPRIGLIHAGVGRGRSLSDWQSVASENALIVFLSSEAFPSGLATAYVHYFEKTCQDVANYVTHDLANRFIVSCDTGNPDFKLFYPRSIDNLVALYLLQLANLDADKDREDLVRIRRDAEYEYFEITSNNLPQDSSEVMTVLKSILSAR